MLAHISFPTLTEQANLPATLSPAIAQGLLREQIGFKGVILSDCMEMKAISDTFGTEQAAVMALQAGVDLVLVSHHYARQRGSVEAIQAAVRTQELTLQLVQQAAEHVLSLKARYLSWKDLPTTGTVPSTIGCEKHVQLQSQAYELSTTLVRNEDALIPLRLNSGELIVVISPQRNTVSMVEDRYYSDELLVGILRQYHTHVEIAPMAPGSVEKASRKLLQTTSETDTLIVATVNAHLDEQQAKLVRRIVASGRRIIVIAVRNPYDLQAFPQLRTYLVTYEYTRPALVTAVRVLFDEKRALGYLPVSIPGLEA
jgi:beta-N-acetylhexosaminidase